MSRADAANRDALAKSDGRMYDLHGVIVTYEGRPDRCTIYPRDTRPSERIAAWLSADADAFVALERMR
jgi:hypothetical protein